jgi:hypothetical protein
MRRLGGNPASYATVQFAPKQIFILNSIDERTTPRRLLRVLSRAIRRQDPRFLEAFPEYEIDRTTLRETIARLLELGFLRGTIEGGLQLADGVVFSREEGVMRKTGDVLAADLSNMEGFAIAALVEGASFEESAQRALEHASRLMEDMAWQFLQNAHKQYVILRQSMADVMKRRNAGLGHATQRPE